MLPQVGGSVGRSRIQIVGRAAPETERSARFLHRGAEPDILVLDVGVDQVRQIALRIVVVWINGPDAGPHSSPGYGVGKSLVVVLNIHGRTQPDLLQIGQAAGHASAFAR